MRSILFVPATRIDLLKKAVTGEASAICLDLEDGVAPDMKGVARLQIAEGVTSIKAAGKGALVRINSDLSEISFDLGVIPKALDHVVLPMAASRHQIDLLAKALDAKFGASGPKIVAMVEGADGLRGLQVENRPLPSRLSHLAMGTEDFAASQGCAPDAAPIGAAFDQLALFAAEWELHLLGYPGSIAAFRDVDVFAASVERGRETGAVGGFGIHPKQLTVLNDAFGVSQAQQEWAQRVVDAFEQALKTGHGAIQLDGKMIDKPVYLAAKKVLARA